MKENMKNIFLMGLGAISLTGEKACELKKELLEKGESLYKEGAIKNEELKRDIKEKIKENATIEYTSVTKEEIIDIIKNMSDEEKEEIKNLLKNKSNENSESQNNESEEQKSEENKSEENKKEDN